MSTRLLVIKVFCYGVISFLCQVTWCDSEVTWVTRNVTDSFRIGQDGCLNNESICTLHQASCQDDGSCLCNKENPHFRNPIILLDDTPRYGNSYGCIIETAVSFRVEEEHCKFRPYQVIPNDHKEPAIQFTSLLTNGFQIKSCELISFEAKFPNNRSHTPITWINETYFQLSFLQSTLCFMWKKSVPELEGLIITINLFCKRRDGKYDNQCLQAKVLGTWRSSVPGTTPSTTSASNSISGPSSTNVGTIPTTTNNSTNPGKLFSDESKLGEGMIAAAVVVPLIVLIFVILVAIYLMKRRKRNRDREMSKRSISQGNNGTGNMGMSYQTDSNSQSTSAAGTSSEYAKPDIQRVMVNGDTYAVSDKQTNKPKQKDTAAAPNVSSDSEYAKPDIERIMVNGDMYAVANKNNTIKKPIQELNYMDPENLGLHESNPDDGQSTQPTEYAAIVGVMHENE